VGTSVAQTALERRQQFHTLRLNEHLDPLNPAVNDLFRQGQDYFLRLTGDSAASREMTLEALRRVRAQQALSLSYFDIFWVSGALAFFLILLIPLMRRSVAAKGTHVGAE